MVLGIQRLRLVVAVRAVRGAAGVGAAGLNGVGHGWPAEVLRLAGPAVAVHRVQGRAVVGVKAVVVLAAVRIVLAVSPLGSLGIRQLHGVGQLNRGKVGDGDVDLPHKALVGRTVLAFGVVFEHKVIG